MMKYFVKCIPILVLFSQDTILENATDDKTSYIVTDPTTISATTGAPMKKASKHNEVLISTITTLRPPDIKIDTLDWDTWCKLQANGNLCDEQAAEYYYDMEMDDCKTFKYGGCPNNRNNFHSLEQCQSSCRDSGPEVLPNQKLTPNIFCQMQPVFGECTDYIPMFYFDVTTARCLGFSYSGCGGNLNRFETTDECFRVCTKETYRAMEVSEESNCFGRK